MALAVLMLAPQAWMQPVVILLGGVSGALLFHESAEKNFGYHAGEKAKVRGKWWHSVLPAALIMGVLMFAPALFSGNQDARAMGGLLHAGALVFGGGHVVLPLLETTTVDPGFVAKDTFLAGYGAAQAVPGPMFTFCGFLGADMKLLGNAWLGGAVGIVAVFLPGMVLLAGGLPVWDRLKHFAWARAGVRGANATVVGVLGSALLAMLLGTSIVGVVDVAAVIVLVLAIHFKWLPVWAIVLVAAVVGWVGM
jgi:chromate transporter